MAYRSHFNHLHASLGSQSPPRLDAESVSYAVAVDAQATQRVELALVWRSLVEGRFRVEDAFFTGTRCGLVLARQPHDAQALLGRRLVVLESLLYGVGQKRIAIELNLAPSTIAFVARLALQQLGVYGRPSRAHPMLMLAATASRHPEAQVMASESLLADDSDDRRVIGMPRPDAGLAAMMPKAELEVVRQLVEGRCYAEISSERGTSARTTANQVAAAFRRLEASGRSELIQRLFVVSGLIPQRMRPDYLEGSHLPRGGWTATPTRRRRERVGRGAALGTW